MHLAEQVPCPRKGPRICVHPAKCREWASITSGRVSPTSSSTIRSEPIPMSARTRKKGTTAPASRSARCQASACRNAVSTRVPSTSNTIPDCLMPAGPRSSIPPGFVPRAVPAQSAYLPSPGMPPGWPKRGGPNSPNGLFLPKRRGSILLEVHNGPDLLLSFRLRAVSIGVQATFAVLGALVLYPILLHSGRVSLPAYYGTLALGAAGAAAAALLPWRRLFEAGTGMRFMYAWSVLDILLVTLLVGLVREPDGSMFFLYALTTVFSGAASYPRRAQLCLLAFTSACYLGVQAVAAGDVDTAALFLRLAILATAAFLAGFLSRELGRQIGEHGETHTESARRAALLATVAGAARSINSLDSDLVLAGVVGSAISLGFDGANFAFFDEGMDTFRLGYAYGLPEDYVTAAAHPATAGMPGIVLERRETVVVADYQSHPRAAPRLREAGFEVAIGAPVWLQGRLVAVLCAGTTSDRHIGQEDVEAFELLAALAGRALENARAFEEERRTVERLAELDRLKQDFFATVSHELRTPLTVIKGTGLTLEKRWDSLRPEVALELVGRANDNVRTLESIITTLLDFSRLEAGKMPVNLETVDLRLVLRSAATRLSGLFREGALTTDFAEPLPVLADRTLLGRVAENLLTNAAKHTPPGTRVRLSAFREGASARVEVADGGPGIPPEELRRLGERFFRGGDVNTRRSRGLGLGLAFVREILELHGSALEVESAPGRGARFRFGLPLLADPALEGHPKDSGFARSSR